MNFKNFGFVLDQHQKHTYFSYLYICLCTETKKRRNDVIIGFLFFSFFLIFHIGRYLMTQGNVDRGYIQ